MSDETPAKDTASPGARLRCAWTVTAGIIPGQLMPEYTRRWALSSETFYAETEDQETFRRFRDEAHEYARDITNPGYLNWVHVEWIYL